MKSQELRIGDLVWACGDMAKILTIEQESCLVEFFDYQSERPQQAHIEYNDIEGIEIAAEWLKDFGFEKSGKAKHEWVLTVHEEWIIGVDFGETLTIVSISFDSPNEFASLRCRIKYFHQLQNMYYALMGSELIIK